MSGRRRPLPPISWAMPISSRARWTAPGRIAAAVGALATADPLPAPGSPVDARRAAGEDLPRPARTRPAARRQPPGRPPDPGRLFRHEHDLQGRPSNGREITVFEQNRGAPSLRRRDAVRLEWSPAHSVVVQAMSGLAGSRRRHRPCRRRHAAPVRRGHGLARADHRVHRAERSPRLIEPPAGPRALSPLRHARQRRCRERCLADAIYRRWPQVTRDQLSPELFDLMAPLAANAASRGSRSTRRASPRSPRRISPSAARSADGRHAGPERGGDRCLRPCHGHRCHRPRPSAW